LSLSSARFLIFASRGSVIGESRVFCLFEGGGSIEVDGLEFDDVDFCGVGVFGVEGCDCTPGEELPIKFLLAFVKVENWGYLIYNGGPFGRFRDPDPEQGRLGGSKGFRGH
jgi:hypothetical protein